MSEVLSPSGLEKAGYGSDGWNAIYGTNFEKINDIWTNLLVIPSSQSAATFSNIDDIKNKFFLKYYPILELASGEHSLDLSNVFTPSTIKGDTRALAGHTWIHSRAVQSSKTGAGVGTTTLSSSGNDITISCATTNPDFTGWGNGDKVLIADTSGNVAKYTIDSIVSNTITLTASAPTVNSLGGSISLVPNCEITNAFSIDSGLFTFVGISFSGITDDYVFYVKGTGKIRFENCLFYDIKTALFSDLNGHIELIGAENSILDSDNGILTKHGGVADAQYTTVIKASACGFYADVGASINARNSSALWCERGFCSWNNSGIDAEYALAAKITNKGFDCDGASSILAGYASAKYCNYGYYANRCSFINAYDVSSNSEGNSTNYDYQNYSNIYYS